MSNDDSSQGGQVSEAGGALNTDESAENGADAVTDKTTGTSGANDHEGDSHGDR